MTIRITNPPSEILLASSAAEYELSYCTAKRYMEKHAAFVCNAPLPRDPLVARVIAFDGGF
jgi:hypothetical protein